MRIVGFLLAAAAGFVCWAMTLALSDGIAPLGRVDAGVSACFFTPIIFFALPLGVLAAVKGRMLTAAWIGALGPVLGAANFGLAMSSHVGASPDPATFDRPPSTFALVWLALLALVLGGMAGARWIGAQARKPPAAR